MRKKALEALQEQHNMESCHFTFELLKVFYGECRSFKYSSNLTNTPWLIKPTTGLLIEFFICKTKLASPQNQAHLVSLVGAQVDDHPYRGEPNLDAQNHSIIETQSKKQTWMELQSKNSNPIFKWFHAWIDVIKPNTQDKMKMSGCVQNK